MKQNAPSLIITRPIAAAKSFARALRCEGFDGEIVISPVTVIRPEKSTINWDGIRGVIFTSRNAVKLVKVQNVPCWCVGDATARCAMALGWEAKSASGTADDLVRRILADAPSGPLLHLRGLHSRGNIAARLASGGIEVHEQVVYEQEQQALNSQAKALLLRENSVIIPLFSPNSAVYFASSAPFKASLRIAAMSDAVADEIRHLGPENLVIAQELSAESMIKAVKDVLDTGYGIEGP